MTQEKEERRLGFVQGAPGQVTLLIAAVVVMLFFAWGYI
jgi:hypothetical protein